VVNDLSRFFFFLVADYDVIVFAVIVIMCFGVVCRTIMIYLDLLVTNFRL
jgi:hypothetical protein